MMKQYGLATATAAASSARAAGILQGLTTQLRAQQKRGSEFLIGTQLSALDIYWSCFSQMAAPLPHAQCPMPDYVRGVYGDPPQAVKDALDPILLAHRDRIFERYIGLPLEF